MPAVPEPQLLVASRGVALSTAYQTFRRNPGNTAYEYATGVWTDQSYSNPAWITSLAASKVGLGNVENTALSTWAGSTSLTTLGTITTGTIPVARVSGLGSAALSSTSDFDAAGAAAAVTLTTLGGTAPTGTGAVVRATSPTLVGPALGTPSSGTLTNCTGLVVAGGGTGVASTTAYAVLCGGTTSTGALQSVASVGTSGQVLTSNGAGALPTFQAASAAAAGTLTGTTLAANVVTSSLTSVGTLSAGSIPYSLVTGGPSSVSGANPTASVGLTAVNGSAGTFLRSDGAPALDQTIAPTWTGQHLFKNTSNSTSALQVQQADGTIVVGVDTTNKRLGIGTATPSSKFNVIDSTSINGEMRFSSSLVSSTGGTNLDFYANNISTIFQMSRVRTSLVDGTAGAQNTTLEFQTLVSGTLAERMRIHTDGSVGIGTSSPTSKVHISGATSGGAITLRISNANGRIYSLMSGDSTGNAGTGGGVTANGFAISDASSGVTRLSVDANGLFGVNVNVPAAQLHVVSYAAGTIGQIVKGAASRTAQLQQFQTSAGGSLGNVSGGCIFDHFADGASTHTDGTEDTLYTDTLVANAFIVAGDSLVVRYIVQFVGSATATRRVRIYFAGVAIFDSGTLTIGATGGTVVYDVLVTEKTSTTCRALVEQRAYGSAALLADQSATYTSEATLTGLTLTGTNIVKITGVAAGTGAASGDLAAVMGKGFIQGFGS